MTHNFTGRYGMDQTPHREGAYQMEVQGRWIACYCFWNGRFWCSYRSHPASSLVNRDSKSDAAYNGRITGWRGILA